MTVTKKKNPKDGKHILVVDDEAAIQDMLGSLIRTGGHNVIIANNGLEALHVLAETDVDLILMDIRMPEMDGLAAAKFLRQCEQGEYDAITDHPELAKSLADRKKGSRTPIVAVTANIHHLGQVLEAGMDELIPKPFTIKSIFDAIAQYSGE